MQSGMGAYKFSSGFKGDKVDALVFEKVVEMFSQEAARYP
jgi:hypothetical protein